MNIKGAKSLHIHPHNLHFLKCCLKKLHIGLNEGKQQHGYSPDRVKCVSSVHGQSTHPGLSKPKPWLPLRNKYTRGNWRSISRVSDSFTCLLLPVCSLKLQEPFTLLGGLDPPWACPTVSDGVTYRVSQLVILNSNSLFLVHRCFHTTPLLSPVILLSSLHFKISLWRAFATSTAPKYLLLLQVPHWASYCDHPLPQLVTKMEVFRAEPPDRPLVPHKHNPGPYTQVKHGLPNILPKHCSLLVPQEAHPKSPPFFPR